MLLTVVPFASAEKSMDNFIKTDIYWDDQFTDVKAADWYAAGVQGAFELGLMKGSSDNAFAPSKTLSVAEAYVIACRLYSIYNDDGMVFMQGSPWYQVYVDYAARNHIVTAAMAAQLDPKKAITREQFAYLMCGAIPSSELTAINAVGEIPDMKKDSTFGGFVYRLYDAGVLTGNDKYGTFTPTSTIQRSAVATIVNRIADPAQRQKFTLEKALVQEITLAGATACYGGETLQWTAATKPAKDVKLTWASGNPGVATVDQNGKITAIRAGQSNITVTAPNGVKKTVMVTVKAKTPLFAKDGRIIEVKPEDVEKQVKVGWYKTQQPIVYTKQGYMDDFDGIIEKYYYGSGVLSFRGSGTTHSYSKYYENATMVYYKRGIKEIYGGQAWPYFPNAVQVEYPDTATSVDLPEANKKVRVGIPASVKKLSNGGYYEDRLVIYCPVGSYAWNYAAENDIEHVAATQIFHPDDRTMMVTDTERALYLSNGWYDVPVTTLYAKDGRTMVCKVADVAAQQKVGWYTYDQMYTTLFALDGRCLDFKNDKVAANLKAGWYYYPDYVCAYADKLAKSSGYMGAVDYIEEMSSDFYGNATYHDKFYKKYTELLGKWRSAAGAPIIVTGSYMGFGSYSKMAYFTIRNLSEKTVTAFQISFTLCDAYGDPLRDSDGTTMTRTSDWNLGRWMYTNEQGDFSYSGISTSAYQIKNIVVKKVAFSDGTSWKR